MSNFTIQDIFIQYGDEYIKNHNLSKEQWDVYNTIRNCKTRQLGVHRITCEHCGETTIGYNSCRNRHCPMCQSYAREKWIERESKDIIDCPYFHIVTTIPIELNELTLYNKKIMYNILFKSTSEAIQTLAEDTKWLGAKVGITSILHTWGQTLELHPHIHSIVTGGGLKNNKWVQCNNNYLFKVQVLSSLFRGKFLSYLKHNFNNLNFPKSLEYLRVYENFNNFLTPLYSKQWITYIEPPKGDVQNVIEYVGRYSFRVAISNNRIKSIDNHKIIFEYKDYKDNGKIKLMTLDALEFIRRFLLHVLPDNFTKIKHYGILTNRSKSSNIRFIRYLIAQIINSNFTISLDRKVHEYLCPTCNSNKFIYAFFYPKNRSCI